MITAARLFRVRNLSAILLVSVAVGLVTLLTLRYRHAAWAALAVPIRVLPPHPAPQVGQLAPDFELPSSDGTQRVRLSGFRGQRPVALVFASITCPYFRNEAQALERLYRQYGDRIQFLMVYQQEAHPVEAESIAENVADGIEVGRPQSLADRCEACQQVRSKLSLSIPAIVDELNDQVAYDYMPGPFRFFLVDVSGKIAFQTTQAPWSFQAPDVEQAILTSLPTLR